MLDKAPRGPRNNNKRKTRGDALVRGELAFVRATEAAGVSLVRAPRGLSRRTANRSRVHPKYALQFPFHSFKLTDRHKCLNWSVEWIRAATGQALVRPCLETMTLREAYDRVFPRAKDEEGSTSTGNESEGSYRNVYFYLHRQRTAAGHRNVVLVPVSPAATMRDVLRGRSVVEFPTVYVLEKPLGEEDERFVLEEVYLSEHPGDVDGGSRAEDVEEDYTSSEGSSDESSEEEDEDEEEDEKEELPSGQVGA